LRGSVRAARAHPFLHPLPLVAEGSMITKAIQKDLVSGGTFGSESELEPKLFA
jgi:hypothetical protein